MLLVAVIATLADKPSQIFFLSGEMEKSKAQYQTQRDDCRRKYLATLKTIVDCIHKKNDGDPDIEELKDHFDIARREAPQELLEASGPYLWKYRQPIKNREVQEFMKKDLLQENPQLENKRVEALRIINRMRLCWDGLNPEEQNFLWENLKMALAHYAGYLQCCQQIKKFS